MQNNEELNKSAWNSEVIKHNYWTKAVSQEQIERAKNKDLILPLKEYSFKEFVFVFKIST